MTLPKKPPAANQPQPAEPQTARPTPPVAPSPQTGYLTTQSPYKDFTGRAGHLPQIADPKSWVGSESFLAAHFSRNCPVHLVKLMYRACWEVYGIEARREVHQYFVKINRRSAGAARIILGSVRLSLPTHRWLRLALDSPCVAAASTCATAGTRRGRIACYDAIF
jgi:hypothetical protein